MARLPKCKRSAEEIAASALSAWQSRAIAAETQVKKLKAARPKVLYRDTICPKDFKKGSVTYVGRAGCGECSDCPGAQGVLIIAAPKGKEARP